MIWLVSGAVGLILTGPIGAVVCAALIGGASRLSLRPKPHLPPLTIVLILLLVELRGGMSVLAALTRVSEALPDDLVLRSVARLAALEGLEQTKEVTDERLQPVVAQLARAQRTGASAADTLRRQLDDVISSQRSRSIERARALPVKLMIPVTLLMLPGMILLLYAPSLLRMFSDLTGGLA